MDSLFGDAQRLRIYAGMEEFLLPVTVAKFIIKKFIVITIAQQSIFCPKLLLKYAPLLIVSTSSPLVQNHLL
jgi:hypothetical protein